MKLADESKIFIIVFITLAISAFHLTAPSRMGIHMIHRELFFIPIVLSCFWFGLKPGLVVAGIVSIIYVSQSFFGTDSEILMVPTLFQVFTFFLVTAILGVLVNHNEKVHADNIRKKELAALGNAALNIGIEIRDVLAALKKAYFKLTVDPPEKDEIEEGFERLDNLVKILTSFISRENIEKMNTDMNAIVVRQIAALKEKAGSIVIHTQLDEKTCPSKVSEESIAKLIKDLIVNAVEASPQGGTIWVRTCHMPTYNILEVQDEGLGIKQQHLKKIFSPFFTTKENSHGLSLASDYKFIQSIGGEMAVSSTFGRGTSFKVKIPVDDPSNPIGRMNKISDWNPKEKGRLFKR